MGIDLEQLLEEHQRNQEDSEQSNNVNENTKAAEVVVHNKEEATRKTVADDLEPHHGMDFDSKEDAFSFYKQYANFVGFDTIIKASRRSRVSGKFIDAKFVCTKYGSKRESNSSENRYTAVNENGARLAFKRKRGRINGSWSKTDCKACMHVKRGQDGWWVVHNFIKEHNHEFFPKFQGKRKIDLCSSSTVSKKMCVTVSRQSGEMKKIQNKNSSCTSANGQRLAIDKGDVEAMLEHFMYMQEENPYFVYAIDLNPDHGLRNVLWVDAKSRIDYRSFSDVVFFDVTYIKNNFRLPFAPFIGVNHHFQFLLLGCALLADESKSSFSWAMKAWLKAMGGQAPGVMLTDHDMGLKEAVMDVFPHSRHLFCLWHILSKVQENLGYVMRKHDTFVTKFYKCVLKSGTYEQFEKRWQKVVERFDLRNDLWIQLLYEDRKRWVPAYMKDIFLAGMSTVKRSDSMTSLFDKCIQRRTTLKEFLNHCKAILQEKHEEEQKADFETWHKQAALKSPSPFGKQMATIYTHAIFKKFQDEVLGAVACHPKKENKEGEVITYKVQDLEENNEFIVVWNEITSDISCSCLLFEYNGFLCRHAMIVLQMSGSHGIPSQYILKRWTKDAKCRKTTGQIDATDSRIQRYNNLHQQALKLGDEGSLCQESYNIALNTLKEAMIKCESLNGSIQGVLEPSSPIRGVHNSQEITQSNCTSKTSCKHMAGKEKVVQEPESITLGMHGNWQQVEQLISRVPPLDGLFGNQKLVQGMGHLNSTAPIHDGHYLAQQRLHSLGHMHFGPQTIPGGFHMQNSLPVIDQSDVRHTPLHRLSSEHIQPEPLHR